MPVGDNAGAMAAAAGGGSGYPLLAGWPDGTRMGMSERLRERIINSARCECIAERSEAIA
jgi:hypothetical protein